MPAQCTTKEPRTRRDVGSGQGAKNHQGTSGDCFLSFGDDVAPGGGGGRRRRRSRADGDTRRNFHAQVYSPEATTDRQRADAHAHDARRAGRRSRADGCHLPARGGHRPRHACIHHHRHRYPKTFNPCFCLSLPFLIFTRIEKNRHPDWNSGEATISASTWAEIGDRGIAGRSNGIQASPSLGYGAPSVAMASIPQRHPWLSISSIGRWVVPPVRWRENVDSVVGDSVMGWDGIARCAYVAWGFTVSLVVVLPCGNSASISFLKTDLSWPWWDFASTTWRHLIGWKAGWLASCGTNNSAS